MFSEFYIILFDFFFTLAKYLLKRERETPLRCVPAEGEKNLLLLLWITQRWSFRAGDYGKKPPKPRVEHLCLWNGNSRGAFPVAAAPSPGARAERGAPGHGPAALRGNPRESSPAWSPAGKPRSETHPPRHGNPRFEGRLALSRGSQAPVGK